MPRPYSRPNQAPRAGRLGVDDDEGDLHLGGGGAAVDTDQVEPGAPFS